MVVPPSKGISSTAEEVLAILIAILLFYGIPQLPFIRKYFEQSPYIIIGVALVLLIYRKRILEFFR